MDCHAAPASACPASRYTTCTSFGVAPSNWTSRELKRRLANITSVRSYTLENGYYGADCEAVGQSGDQAPWAWLYRDIERFHSTFRLKGDKLVVTHDSRHWLEVTSDLALTLSG